MEERNPISVAIIEPVGGHGGMNYYDFGLCKGLVNAGIFPILYTCDETLIAPDLSFPVQLCFNKIYGTENKLKRGFNFLKGINRSLKDARVNGAKVAHMHLFHTTFLEYFSLKLSKLYGFKTVVTVHDVTSFSGNSSKFLAKGIYNSSNMIIVHNHVSKKAIVGNSSVELKIRIIPHGNYTDYVNTSLTKGQAKEKLGIKGDGPFLLFWGQIKEVKGLDILLNALPDVIKKFPSLCLIIAGKVWKDDFAKYQFIINKNDIGCNIIANIRYIPDELVNYYYGIADMVVLPYRKIYQSGVLLMAMSYGVPVLVSDIEGMTEIVQDNVNGFVFRQGDACHLSEMLIEILGNPIRMMEVGKMGYETVKIRHCWDDIGIKTAQVYEEICSGI